MLGLLNCNDLLDKGWKSLGETGVEEQVRGKQRWEEKRWVEADKPQQQERKKKYKNEKNCSHLEGVSNSDRKNIRPKC